MGWPVQRTALLSEGMEREEKNQEQEGGGGGEDQEFGISFRKIKSLNRQCLISG